MTATTPFTDDRLRRRIRTGIALGIVTTYDTRPAPDGRHRIGYASVLDTAAAFRGSDITVPPGQAIDSDETLSAVVDFLSLRPDDSDPEYSDQLACRHARRRPHVSGETLRTHVQQRIPSTSADVTSIGETRQLLDRIRVDAGDLACTLEILQAHLATADLDPATLQDIADVLEPPLPAPPTATLPSHGLLEDAIQATPHPAKTISTGISEEPAMPLMTLPTLCWTFTCQQEDADAARWRPHAHHPAQLPALHVRGCDLPYQLDAPCVVALCDRCHVAYTARHFAAHDQATEHLQAAGWTTDGHGHWHCDACPILYQLSATGDAAVRVAGAAR